MAKSGSVHGHKCGSQPSKPNHPSPLLVCVLDIAAPRSSLLSAARIVARSLPLLSPPAIRPEMLAIDQLDAWITRISCPLVRENRTLQSI